MTGAAFNTSRIAAWTEAILAGEIGTIVRVFMQHGAGAPELVWEPSPEQLPAPPLRFLAEHWRRLAPAAGPPHRRHIDPLELRPALGYLMLLEPVDDCRDFRYRLYGSELSRISGLDMTGRLLSQHVISRYAADFGIAVYRAAALRGRPLYSSRSPVGAEDTNRWARLALPFVDDDGTVTRILAGSAALRIDGTMIP